MRKSTIFITILLVFLFDGLYAQRTYDRADFEKINATYAALTTLETEVEYVLFPNHTTTETYEKQKASLWRKGDKMRYKIAGVETLTTPERTYLIDHDDRQLIVNKTLPTKQNPLTGIDLDKLLALCRRISYTRSPNGHKTYVLEVPMPDIEKVAFTFDTQSFLMQKVVLYYRQPQQMEKGMKAEKPRMEIRYLRQDPTPTFPKKVFEENYYAFVKNGRRVPGQAFINYEFIDHTTLK